jgi:7-cyano-7-deazaguanine synthase
MSGVLLYSGGMDSLIAWYWMKKPEALYVKLGHRYQQKELDCLVYLPPEPVVKMSHYGAYFEEDDAHIPGRNFYLCMYAAAMGYDKIHLVCQKGEQNIPDRSPAFFSMASVTLSTLFDRDITVNNPFSGMYKHEMVAWYLDQGLPYSDLHQSVSCYQDDSTPLHNRDQHRVYHCGVCGSCFRKWAALVYCGVDCDNWFAQDVRSWGIEEYGPRVHEYDTERQKVMKKVLGV